MEGCCRQKSLIFPTRFASITKLLMFFNRYVLILFVTSILSGSSLWLVINRLDPFADERIALPLFFIALFFFAACFTSLLGYMVRLTLYRHEVLMNHFNVSLRQGIVLSFCISAFFGLQMLRTLTWWSGILLIFLTLLIELYFVAKE